jgi:hypothetical protein
MQGGGGGSGKKARSIAAKYARNGASCVVVLHSERLGGAALTAIERSYLQGAVPTPT